MWGNLKRMIHCFGRAAYRTAVPVSVERTLALGRHDEYVAPLPLQRKRTNDKPTYNPIKTECGETRELIGLPYRARLSGYLQECE